mgnify:FL=1
MKRLSLEFSRLFREPFTWLILFLTLLSPAAGLFWYQPLSTDTSLSLYLANPALAGGTAGGILFGILTIYELDRPRRMEMESLMDAVVAPQTMALLRLLALMGAALIAAASAAVLWLPLCRLQVGSVFRWQDYVLACTLLMGASFPLAILAAAAAFQFTGRANLALSLFGLFAGLSLTVWSEHWQLCWLNPCLWALSDAFSNLRAFRSVAYMRLTWLAALLGLWLISWLGVRRYGLGFLRSLGLSCRPLFRPLLGFLLLLLAGGAYAAQPLVDHSNPDLTAMAFGELSRLQDISCLSRTVQAFPDTRHGSLTASASYEFENRSGQSRKAAFGLNPGYRVFSVLANGASVPFSVGDYQEYNEAMLEVTLPPDQEIDLVIRYGGFPRESRSLSAMQGSLEISSSYLCLANGDLAPRLMNVSSPGSIPAAVEIRLPSSMTVIPFGPSQAEILREHGDGTLTWRYESSGFGGILYAGDYIRRDIKADGVSIQLYYSRRSQGLMEEAGAEEAVRAVVDYCTEHYGPLSFGQEGTLKLVQSRIVGGGYAANGASLLDEGDFSAVHLEDGQRGGIPGEVMIHELVHQWWGLSCMFDSPEESSPWAAEGLTVYTTYRIVKELYGGEYARTHYIEQWEKEVLDYDLNFYVRRPEYLSGLPEDKQLEIANSLSYVRRYCQMPLKILKAQELVGGEEAMDRILRELFSREPDPAYPYLTYEDFLNACGLREEDLNS